MGKTVDTNKTVVMKHFEQIMDSLEISKDPDFPEFQKLYDNVKNNINKNAKPYGCDKSTIELMLFIRRKLMDKELVPKTDIGSATLNNKLKNIDKGKWMTAKYKKMFNIADEEITSRLNDEYNVDGWNYAGIENLDNNDWIIKTRRGKLTHLYYNQLDHYLTYLVGRIKVGQKKDCIRKGCNIKSALNIDD